MWVVECECDLRGSMAVRRKVGSARQRPKVAWLTEGQIESSQPIRSLGTSGESDSNLGWKSKLGLEGTGVCCRSPKSLLLGAYGRLERV